jgi:anti-sigma factor RsiW
MTHENHNHKFCRQLFEKLSEYIDEELDEMTCKEFEMHLRECIKCSVCHETLKRTVDLCRNMHSHPVPSTLSDKIMALIPHIR